MLRELRDKWVAALRSGDYKQGEGYLRKSNGEDVFCCLGVLIDVIDPDLWVAPGPNAYDRGYEANDSGTTLSLAMQEKHGLCGGITDTLIGMNDGASETQRDFNGIADYIEENL